MKPCLKNKRAEGLWLFAVVSLVLSLLWVDHGWAASGLSLNLYTRQESHKFSADQPIPIIGVMKNETKWPLNLDLGFSQIEIERYFIAKDPQGVRHTPPFQEIQASDMPPPSKWGQWETVPAEVLPSGWQRSVDIDDLRELFPVMQRLSGWYTLEVELPFSRYGWTVSEAGSDRLLGVMDDKASHGTLKSKKLRIFVAPARGGRMKIRVEDLSTPEQTARSNVEIRVFRRNDLQDKSLADAWATLDSITRGNTGLGGWVTLPPGGSCLPEPFLDDAYVAIAKYKGEYKEADIENGADGWQTECGGLLTRYILFGEVPQEFSVFGLDSVLIRNNARIESGHVGAQAQCDSCVVPGFEVALQDTWVADGYQIKGNRVQISGSVWDILCNSYDNQGMIRGEITQPLDLPVWTGLPELFPSNFNPLGNNTNDNCEVESQGTLTLEPTDICFDVVVGSHGTLYLKEGEYHFRDMSLGSHARVVCLGPVDIRIKGRLDSGSAKAAYLGPGAGSDIGPEDVVVYVQGTGGVLFGQGHNIRANIYARNGTFDTGEGCTLTGSFIANDVIIGQKTVVNYVGAFSQGGETPTPNNPPTADFLHSTDGLTATFIDQSSDSDGIVVSWDWDFGDGSYSTAQNPSHTYGTGDAYTVMLTVTDDDGATNTGTQVVTVSGGTVEITLTATSLQLGSNYYVDLVWSGATVSLVDIYRNSDENPIATTANDGSYTDKLGKDPSWPYIYKVCEQGTDICSSEEAVFLP